MFGHDQEHTHEQHEHKQMPKPTNAIEEAMLRIGMALQMAIKERAELPFFAFYKRIHMAGAIYAMKFIFELLHHLGHKYENKRGELN